jgi:hypothetical protein
MIAMSDLHKKVSACSLSLSLSLSENYSDMDLAYSLVLGFRSGFFSTVAEREDFQRSFVISKQRSR